MCRTIKFLLILLWLVISTGCTETKTVIREFPDGFQGFIVIVFGVDGFPALPNVDGNELIKMPADGILITCTPQYTGWEHVENYYIDAAGKRLRELKEQNAQGGASGPLDMSGSGATVYFTFVGPFGSPQSDADYIAKTSEAKRRVRMHYPKRVRG